MRFEMGASLVDTARSSGSSNDCFLHDLFGEEKREHPLGTFVFLVFVSLAGGEKDAFKLPLLTRLVKIP